MSVATSVSVLDSGETSCLLTNHLRPRRILIQQGTPAIVRQPFNSMMVRLEKNSDIRYADSIKHHLSLKSHHAF